MAEVRVVDSADEREDAFAVRRTVFVEEQDVDEALEYDEYEDESVHFVAYDDGSEDSGGDEAGERGEPIGVARLREPKPGVGKVERVAVLEGRREEGIGRELMAAVEANAREQGVTTLKLHAQTHAAEFYRRLGYERRGEEFDEAGIPHVEMRKSLAE